jgi:cysteine desulfuration protein SufE
MTLTEREAAWVQAYSLIPDPHERLSALIAHRSEVGDLPEADRTESALVPGCQTRVWLTGSVDARGIAYFRFASEGTLVRGLVGLLVDWAQAQPAHALTGATFGLWRALRLERVLSPTRQHGLAQVERRLRHIATAPSDSADSWVGR